MALRQTGSGYQKVDAGVAQPASRDRSAPRRSVTVQEAKRCLSGLTALVIDEDAETFGRIFVSLDHVGCRARLARRYVQGEKMVRELRPSFVVIGTDIDGSASELLRTIKADPHLGGTLVLALSSGDNRHERRRLMQAGFDGYLAKPVDLHLFAQELVADVPALADLRDSTRGNS